MDLGGILGFIRLNSREMSRLAAPVEALRLVTPEGKATTRAVRLSELRAAGQPTVIHLYTG